MLCVHSRLHVQANAADESIHEVLQDFGTLKVPYVVVLRKGQIFGQCVCTDLRFLKRILRAAREANAVDSDASDSSSCSDATESSSGES